jgi:Flp pilus assembly protein TadG
MQHTVSTTALRRRARTTTRTRGQALVELAIVLPVFLVLVLAAIDLGRIFFARITVANSAREGAYEAAYGGTYIANAACGPANSVMCAVLNEAQGSLTVAPADVAWSCIGSGGCASGAYGDAVTVQVTGHFDLLTPILAVFFGGTNITFTSAASADIVETPFAGTGASAAPTVEPTPTVLPTVTPFPTPSGLPETSPTPSAPTCAFPIADFTFSQQNKNRPIEFVSTSTPTSGSCQIQFWRWDFGDNTTSAGNPPTISHEYGCQGCTYTVTLTVTNARGPISISRTVVTRN